MWGNTHSNTGSRPQPADEAAVNKPAPETEVAPPVDRPAAVELVRVVMRRDAKCGEAELSVGDSLAEIRLPADVSLNYLVDAVRNGIAGPEK